MEDALISRSRPKHADWLVILHTGVLCEAIAGRYRWNLRWLHHPFVNGLFSTSQPVWRISRPQRNQSAMN